MYLLSFFETLVSLTSGVIITVLEKVSVVELLYIYPCYTLCNDCNTIPDIRVIIHELYVCFLA